MSPLESLSVVIPAFNEAQRIGPTLQTVTAWLAANVADYELLVVDDGSSDGTVRVAREFDGVRVIENGRNRGKGYSVANGVRQSAKRWILFSDADLSTPIADLLGLAAAASETGAELAIGSRALADSDIVEHQPWYREAMGRTFNKIVQVVAVPGIRDTQCGFKLFRADVAKELFAQTTIEGFAFDVEVLFLARRHGYRIVEVPVTWENDDRTRVHAVYDSLRMLRDVINVRVSHSRLLGR